MRAPTARRKPRRASVVSFPAPTSGMISNRNLARLRAGRAAVGMNVNTVIQAAEGMRRTAVLQKSGDRKPVILTSFRHVPPNALQARAG